MPCNRMSFKLIFFETKVAIHNDYEDELGLHHVLQAS